MSWLLVAFVPGLLMLATFGLERLETGLNRETVTATDVAEFLEQADSHDVSLLARDGMPRALDYLHRRRAERITESPRLGSGGVEHDVHRFPTGVTDEPDLPTRRYTRSQANPQFRAPKPTDRV